MDQRRVVLILKWDQNRDGGPRMVRLRQLTSMIFNVESLYGVLNEGLMSGGLQGLNGIIP